MQLTHSNSLSLLSHDSSCVVGEEGLFVEDGVEVFFVFALFAVLFAQLFLAVLLALQKSWLVSFHVLFAHLAERPAVSGGGVAAN